MKEERSSTEHEGEKCSWTFMWLRWVEQTVLEIKVNNIFHACWARKICSNKKAQAQIENPESSDGKKTTTNNNINNAVIEAIALKEIVFTGERRVRNNASYKEVEVISQFRKKQLWQISRIRNSNLPFKV